MSEESESKTVPPVFYCTFCGKSQNEVAVIVRCESACICDICIDICTDIVQKNRDCQDNEEPDAKPEDKEAGG